MRDIDLAAQTTHLEELKQNDTSFNRTAVFEIDENGVAGADWVPLAKFKSYPDRLHGGVIATLADSAMVHALFAKGITGVTAEINIRYLEAVALDSPVRITGWVEGGSRRLHRCRAEVSQHGKVAVCATAKFVPLPPEKP